MVDQILYDKIRVRTDMPMIQIKVSSVEALKFVDRMTKVGWEAHYVKYPSGDGVDIHFTDKLGQTTLDYSVTIVGEEYAYIGTRPQDPETL